MQGRAFSEMIEAIMDTMNNDQLGFEFLPDLPTAPVPPKKRAPATRKAVAQAPVTVATAPAAPMADAEAMAKVLEAHPDFKVLRRLKPVLMWPTAADVAVTRVVVLDTETTGLDQSKEKIIELALLRVDIDTATGLPVGPLQVYDGLEDPGRPIPKEVVAITGLTDADVHGQHIDDERVAALMEGVDLVIAHNAAFDRPFVEARFAQFAQLSWACSFADIDWKAQGRGSAKLESLAQANGWFYDAHRAEMDCHALLAVLATPLPQTPQTGLARLLQAAGQPSFRLSATNAPFESKDKLKARGYRWNGDQRVWQTRLADPSALQAELAWLKDNAYNNRSAVVQIEKLDARTKYSTRSGAVTHQQL
jgi:DNA polymerase-3 subunit epsilon